MLTEVRWCHGRDGHLSSIALALSEQLFRFPRVVESEVNPISHSHWCSSDSRLLRVHGRFFPALFLDIGPSSSVAMLCSATPCHATLRYLYTAILFYAKL